jgi:hypothetical protein
MTPKYSSCEMRGAGDTFRRIRTATNLLFRGVNHEISPPERLIGTFEFERLPETGHVILQKASFEELLGNRTKLTSQSVFLSVEESRRVMQADKESKPVKILIIMFSRHSR